MSRPRLCIVTAVPLTLRAFMRNHLLSLSAHYDVTAIANFAPDDLSGEWLPGIRLVPVSIARQISPRADLVALMSLLRFFHAQHFDVVHSVTPKAGLLVMSAARMARVPHRIHWFTGQVWATRRGLGRSLLEGADRLIIANATRILTDSHSQRAFLEDQGVLRKGQAEVLGHGSISGVDLDRFHPDDMARNRIRDELGVPQSACLLLFVGRLNRDKGVLDLAQAFARLARERNDAWLVMVGPDEAGIGETFGRICGDASARVRRVDYTATPEHYMAAADLFVLPSYREGFGSVVIEAAACGIPAVASRIYGLTDAVQDGVTGLLHSPADVGDLHAKLALLCQDRERRATMGKAARARAIEEFSMASVSAALLAYYEKILGPAMLG